LEQLQAGDLALPIQLDTLAAARKRVEANSEIAQAVERFDKSHPSDDPLAPHRVCLEGGDVDRGRRIFFERFTVACNRCHRVGTEGGSVGPELTSIGKDQSREQLLESIIAPNASIAKGFETLVVTTDAGRVLSGILQEKTKDQIFLLTPEGKLITVQRDEIDELAKGASSMPADVAAILTPHDLRDLVEYLANLKES
ncbi:MAG TPA: glucose dehydrogenase, partial [Pirellulaceae bacterium]